MHQNNFNLSIEEISKIEGQASLDLSVEGDKITNLKFRIKDYKRFYTRAVEGKSILAVPSQVSRICGTCSNAHLLCSIKAIEQATGLQPTQQTKLLRQLLNYGLMIRDHALHLYIFVLPDIFGKDSILDFDEEDKNEHQFLHDAFAVKRVGNELAKWSGGRSVHAPFALVGGFTKIPGEDPKLIIDGLKKIRPLIIRLAKLFEQNQPVVEEDLVFVALDDLEFNFTGGDSVITSDNQRFSQEEFHQHLTHEVLLDNQSSTYKLGDKNLMVGSLARINLLKERLHKNTREDLESTLSLFPSKNIFYNNLAQAIEILHSIDKALEILNSFTPIEEKPLGIKPLESLGTALVEAPRGILLHQYKINLDGKIVSAKIVVPTGLNQLVIEKSLKNYLEQNLSLIIENSGNDYKKKIEFEAERLIRVFDPCISCAAHFLKINWL